MADRKKPAKRPAARAKAAQAEAAKDAADAAAERAAAAEATGPRLDGARRALRDSMIIARHAQRVPWAEIAEEAGVDARTCQRVVRAARKLPSPIDAQPMALLESLASGFARSIADYEAMAFSWADVNQSAALGAKKAADETRSKLAALMSEVGKLPENLELFRAEMEMVRIAEQMHGKLGEVVAGEATAEDAFEFFRQLVTRRERAALEAGGA